MSKRTISVDFDGVLHKYSRGWQDGAIYDDPVDGAVAAMHKLSERFTLVVHSTRSLTQEKEIRAWLLRHDFPVMEITAEKRPSIAYIDDRAIRFTNWDDTRKYFL